MSHSFPHHLTIPARWPTFFCASNCLMSIFMISWSKYTSKTAKSSHPALLTLLRRVASSRLSSAAAYPCFSSNIVATFSFVTCFQIEFVPITKTISSGQSWNSPISGLSETPAECFNKESPIERVVSMLNDLSLVQSNWHGRLFFIECSTIPPKDSTRFRSNGLLGTWSTVSCLLRAYLSTITARECPIFAK